jgi:hypothetical protein
MSKHVAILPVFPGCLSRALAALLLYLLAAQSALAMPVFARQYEMTCAACHSAYPRLNAFGEQFRDNNFRLSNWREKTTIDTKDDMLALPKYPPLALRMQTFVQGRQGREVNSTYSGFTENNAEADFQTPYLIKLLSSAPLSDHITYYFYGIFAEKGENGTTLIEDAWFRHDDAFGTKIGTLLGQFQVSDLMFPRETRLTFHDFMAYRMAGITYDRGVIFDRHFGPVSLAFGAVNGNGITDNFTVNSPGYQRADHMFDNDTRKNVFGRIGVDVGPVNAGLFGLSGQQKSRNDALGTIVGARDTDKRIAGLDLSGSIGAKTHWFTQALWNNWQGFLDSNPAQDYRWWGGFAGVDYIHSDHWAFSLLYNYADAGDFESSGTIFEGININTLTVNASYYFMRNVKGVIELTGDFQKETTSFTAHPTKEGYALVGIDAAF